MSMDPSMGGMAGMSGGAGPQEAGSVDDEFTKAFSDMAYAALQRQCPDQANNVVTFRVLEVNGESGRGVGCFILDIRGEIFFVPVIASDNDVKPLDVFYSRRLDRYYPLTPEWLQIAGRSAISELGSGVKAPPTLQTDVDIRNLVVPPTTGRYSYASEYDGTDACWGMITSLAEPRNRPPLQLMSVLSAAPNAVKTAFASVLRKRPRLLQKTAEIYGVKNLTDALELRMEKKAEIRKEWPMKHDVFVYDQSMPVQALKEHMDPKEYGTAFAGSKLHGFWVKDKRKGKLGKEALTFKESDLALTEPTESGRYRVWLSDGSAEDAIVLVGPKHVDGWHGTAIRSHHRMTWSHDPKRSYLVILPDKRCVKLDRLVASPILSTTKGVLDDEIEKSTKEPKKDDYGVFVSSGAMDTRSLCPVRIEKVTSTDRRKIYKTDRDMTVQIDMDQSPPNGILKPNEGNVISLGRGWKFIPCKDPHQKYVPGMSSAEETKSWEESKKNRLEEADFCRSSEEVLRAVERELMHSGAEPMEVKMGFDRQLYVGGSRKPMKLAEAVSTVACKYDISVQNAVDCIKLAVSHADANLWAVPKAKTAAGEAPPGAPPMDPNAMQAPPAPPPPTGLDLAIAEQLQQIQMQIQALNDKTTALQTVQQRAQQIDMGGGAAASPMGAGAMMGGPPPPVGGMPPQDPSQGGQPPMDPSQGGMPPQDPSQGGMPPQDPSQGMMPPGQPGMPPGQPGMPPGQPGMQQPPPPPPPVMTNESLSAGDVENSISPQFLDQAASLDQDHVFDAAAVASLAKQKDLRASMRSYTANLDKSLDSLGRMLMLLCLQEPELKEAIGMNAFTAAEDNVRDTFKGLGNTIISVNQATEHAAVPGVRAR